MDIFTDLISVCKIISVELQHIIALVLSGIGDTEIEKKTTFEGITSNSVQSTKLSSKLGHFLVSQLGH